MLIREGEGHLPLRASSPRRPLQKDICGASHFVARIGSGSGFACFEAVAATAATKNDSPHEEENCRPWTLDLQLVEPNSLVLSRSPC